MPNRFSFGPISLSSTGSAPASSPSRPDTETPFRILLMGDFGAAEGSPAATNFKPFRVDLDNQNTLMERFKVQVDVPFDGPSAPATTLHFNSLESLHPDALCEQLPWFKNVLDLRTQLSHPATFANAAKQLPQWINVEEPAAEETKPTDPAPSTESSESNESMIERLLGKPASEPIENAPTKTTGVDISSLIKEAAAASSVPANDPRQADLVAAVDAAISDRMREVLHHPQFQAIEAAWLGLDLLIKNIELDETIELFILNISKEALQKDLSGEEGLQASHFFQSIVAPVTQGAEGIPWAVWGGNYTFNHESDDAMLLAAMGKLAQAAGTPFIGSMSTEFIELWHKPEDPSPEQLSDWNALRSQPESTFLGLTIPRTLLRLPYGKKSDQIDRFPFEEISLPPSPEQYLWGNGVFACTCLIGQSFTENGWGLGQGGLLTELDGMPLHVYQEDGESKMTPCAEIWLADSTSEELLDQGLISIQSIQRRDAILVPRIQSISNPPTALAGRWS